MTTKRGNMSNQYWRIGVPDEHVHDTEYHGGTEVKRAWIEARVSELAEQAKIGRGPRHALLLGDLAEQLAENYQAQEQMIELLVRCVVARDMPGDPIARANEIAAARSAYADHGERTIETCLEQIAEREWDRYVRECGEGQA